MFIRQFISTMLFGFILLGTVSQLQAAAYKCVNPSGGTEYLDLPREGYTCTELRTVPAPTAATPPAQEDEPKTEPPTQTDAEPRDARQANCKTAQANLDVLQGEQDVVITDKDGNKVLLNSEQRQAELAKARKDANYWCNPE